MTDSMLKTVYALEDLGFDVSLYFYSRTVFESLRDNLPHCFRIYAPRGSFTGIVSGSEGYADEFIEFPPFINKTPDSSLSEGADGKMLTNIGDFSRLPFDGAACGDIGLNIFNSASAESYAAIARSYGSVLSSVTLSPELSADELLSAAENISASCTVRPEIIAYGRLPVMKCEHCVVSGAGAGLSSPSHGCGNCRKKGTYFLTDDKGASFPVLTFPGSCSCVILSSVPTDITDEIMRAAPENFTPDCMPIIRFNIFDEVF